jgi:hypothetical protein
MFKPSKKYPSRDIVLLRQIGLRDRHGAGISKEAKEEFSQ